jgi:A/G-specific adenine glycosylase
MKDMIHSKEQKTLFQQQLIRWFAQHGRDLPWRRTQDPYAILIAEVMLQQTQVERVREYYARFLTTFPTVHILAEATLEQILACWQGLGYYNRARHLHQTAQELVKRYGGIFPSTLEELAQLPGVGRYTAGAILSFAFHQDAPILDTNVKRLLTRIFVRREHRQPGRMEKRLWRLAQDVIPRGKAWIINQAMMDLGATVCMARNPCCAICCMQTICVAYQTTPNQLSLFPRAYIPVEEREVENLVAETLERYGQSTVPSHTQQQKKFPG